jgi:hypothetical protein
MMTNSGKAPRFTIVRLEERIAPGAMSCYNPCGNGSDKGSSKKGSSKKKKCKGSSRKGSSRKGSSRKGRKCK